MDPKRIVLGYAFFLLGIMLTCYQYYHLVDHGPVKPWVRQILLIIIKPVAVAGVCRFQVVMLCRG